MQFTTVPLTLILGRPMSLIPTLERMPDIGSAVLQWEARRYSGNGELANRGCKESPNESAYPDQLFLCYKDSYTSFSGSLLPAGLPAKSLHVVSARGLTSILLACP
jgi:hypothetical protein